jgi:4'-phosphopantetheinyl transferase EntD
VIHGERETAFGWLVMGSLRAALEPGALLEEERAIAATMGPRRVTSFVGGRIALRRALELTGAPGSAVAVTPRGAPALPPAVTGSLSHKDDVVIALAAARAGGEHVGVDLEVDEPLRVDISRRVLRPEEIERAPAGGDRDRWVRTVFALKEAIYKAIDPVVQRYVAFDEVAVDPAADGGASAVLYLDPPAPVFDVTLAWERALGPHGEALIIAFARAAIRYPCTP